MKLEWFDYVIMAIALAGNLFVLVHMILKRCRKRPRGTWHIPPGEYRDFEDAIRNELRRLDDEI